MRELRAANSTPAERLHCPCVQARGPIVDEAALYNALVSHAIGGAVIDVWWHSIFSLPPGGTGPDAWPSQFRFDKLPNVLMSAHVSGDTVESRDEAMAEVATNLDHLHKGLPLINVVRPASPP